MNNEKIITDLSEEQLEGLMKYVPPYSGDNIKNIKVLVQTKSKTKKLPLRFISRRTLIAAVMILLLLPFAGAAYYFNEAILNIMQNDGVITERLDYQFELDADAVGKWEVVDFVQHMDDFTTDKASWNEGLYWLEILFYDDGTALATYDTGVRGLSRKLSGVKSTETNEWTKGYLIKYDIVPSYEIKHMDGADYMFVQWKSGDYTLRGRTPSYYVFCKSSSELPDRKAYMAEIQGDLLVQRQNDDPNITVNEMDGGIYDTMDYHFVTDEKVIGKWEAVDFVKDMDDFVPGKKSWQDNLYWRNITFQEDGTFLSQSSELESEWIWTMGYIFIDDTIPYYTIRTIDGVDYLFVQWKSGDYSYRMMKPYYYVFAR